MKKVELSIQIQKLKTLAKEKGITYEQLSTSADIPIGTIKNIFSGATKNPRLDTVQAIERALRLDSPFTPEEQAAGISSTARMTVTPEEDNLLTLYREIGEKKGSEAQQLAQRLLEQILKA